METKKTPTPLPERVFVRRDQDGDDEYLLAFEVEDKAVDDDGEVAEVGVYELKRTKRMRKAAVEV